MCKCLNKFLIWPHPRSKVRPSLAGYLADLIEKGPVHLLTEDTMGSACASFIAYGPINEKYNGLVKLAFARREAGLALENNATHVPDNTASDDPYAIYLRKQLKSGVLQMGPD